MHPLPGRVDMLCRPEFPGWRLAVLRPRSMVFLRQSEHELHGTWIERASVLFAIRIVGAMSGVSLDSAASDCMQGRVGVVGKIADQVAGEAACAWVWSAGDAVSWFARHPDDICLEFQICRGTGEPALSPEQLRLTGEALVARVSWITGQLPAPPEPV